MCQIPHCLLLIFPAQVPQHTGLMPVGGLSPPTHILGFMGMDSLSSSYVVNVVQGFLVAIFQPSPSSQNLIL